jgi:hypothetical protein
VLAGLQPQVVTTLGEMGIGLEGIATALSLEEALESLGINAIRSDAAARPDARLDAAAHRDALWADADAGMQNRPIITEGYLEGWRKNP